MDQYLISVILGIVEGVTEFLPVSSTGHLIILNEFIDFKGDFAIMFDIVIQFGAILSVVVVFWDKLFPFKKGRSADEVKDVFTIWFKVCVGVIPALVTGALVASIVKKYLFNPVTVSIALVIGGIILLYIENKKRMSSINSITELTYKTAFFIGMFQCLGMIPGTSRSAATIIGAMFLGLSRVAAAEYSFFLAIPTMAAASFYSVWKLGRMLTPDETKVAAAGFIVSFIIAWLVIKIFIKYISRNDFKPFGYYRIAFGVLILLYFTLNIN
ncbi:MAG: undecaprenyl-diphosphatase [Spirochaetae bacterium HGW-Spirochaetae-5]|nr:MAG: undecaprenyl-diphosphatase [Spirochaetae bacterium HGW-Spirochaetae-5]